MEKLPKCYKKMSKKEIKDHLLRQMKANISIVGENYNLNATCEGMQRVIDKLNSDLEQTQQFLYSAENALEYKEGVIDKLEKLLSISVKDL